MSTLLAFVASWLVVGWLVGWSTHSKTIDGGQVMACPRCGEWAVYLQYGKRTCLVCGWTREVEWSEDEEPSRRLGDEPVGPTQRWG